MPFHHVARAFFAVLMLSVPATGATMSYSEAENGSFSRDWSSPSAIPQGTGSVSGTGAGGDYDILGFTGLPAGAQTLSLVATAPGIRPHSYSAGAAVKWSAEPFRYGWDGTDAGSLRLDKRTGEQTLGLSLGEGYQGGSLFVGLYFTHGSDISYTLTLPDPGAVPGLDPVSPGSGDDWLESNAATSPVPVPPAALLLLTGIAGLGGLARFRRG